MTAYLRRLVMRTLEPRSLIEPLISGKPAGIEAAAAIPAAALDDTVSLPPIGGLGDREAVEPEPSDALAAEPAELRAASGVAQQLSLTAFKPAVAMARDDRRTTGPATVAPRMLGPESLDAPPPAASSPAVQASSGSFVESRTADISAAASAGHGSPVERDPSHAEGRAGAVAPVPSRDTGPPAPAARRSPSAGLIRPRSTASTIPANHAEHHSAVVSPPDSRAIHEAQHTVEERTESLRPLAPDVPSIEVTIGRIEIQAAPPLRPSRRWSPSPLTLSDYLDRRAPRQTG